MPTAPAEKSLTPDSIKVLTFICFSFKIKITRVTSQALALFLEFKRRGGIQTVHEGLLQSKPVGGWTQTNMLQEKWRKSGSDEGDGGVKIEVWRLRSSNLIVDVLLELQLLLHGLQAVLCVHSLQHLILQLLPGIG